MCPFFLKMCLFMVNFLLKNYVCIFLITRKCVFLQEDVFTFIYFKNFVNMFFSAVKYTFSCKKKGEFSLKKTHFPINKAHFVKEKNYLNQCIYTFFL